MKMSGSTAVVRSSGAISYPTVVFFRLLKFRIWQALQSSLVFFFVKALLTKTSMTIFFVLSIVFLQLSDNLFASVLSLTSSFQLLGPASVAEDLVSGDRRVGASLRFVALVLAFGVCGGIGVSCACGEFEVLGFRGFVVGVCYGAFYVWEQRWLLQFPIVQRPFFFTYKLGLPSSIARALKLSAVGYLLSGVLSLFLQVDYRSQSPSGKFILEQITFYIESFHAVLRWELSHHLYQVLHTKRFVFAPPKGSAAAETNPSEPLLAALEESMPNSLLQHLAYLDLRMVCEQNVDSWRRAAFFEESGETYKRVKAACLKPLEEFTRKVSESFPESPSPSIEDLLSKERLAVAKPHELLFDSQLCAWCAQIVASLTKLSLKEDRYGVAQLSGSNSSVISTLLSALLAAETLMGKKTSIEQSSSSAHLTGHGRIEWGPTITMIRKSTVSGDMVKLRSSPFYIKAYSLADVLKTSIYCIVSAFHDEMLSSNQRGLLEKDWVSDGKPLYGTTELLVHKLRLFLEFQVS